MKLDHLPLRATAVTSPPSAFAPSGIIIWYLVPGPSKPMPGPDSMRNERIAQAQTVGRACGYG
jgi:hypothetical protein